MPRPIGEGTAAHLPAALEGLVKRRRVRALVAAIQRGSLLQPTARFVAHELRGRRKLRTYGVRGAPLRVVLEHATPDVEAFDEIFCQQIYEPPRAVLDALDTLGHPPRILDVGANVGLFGAYALSIWPGATVTAIEPDPRNASVHRAAIAANARGTRWRLEEAAAAAADAPVRFAAGRYALSGIANPGQSDTIEVRAVDVLPWLEEADLLKVDAEGGEWPILGDARFAPPTVRAVALEFHPINCPEGDARTAAVGRLTAAGFEVADVPTRAPSGYGSLWAWRIP